MVRYLTKQHKMNCIQKSCPGQSFFVVCSTVQFGSVNGYQAPTVCLAVFQITKIVADTMKIKTQLFCP